MENKIERGWHGNIMAEKSLLPFPYTFICTQDYINIGNIMGEKRSYLGANNNHWKGGKTIQLCEMCGKEYKVKPYLVGVARFCSQKCASKWRGLYFSGSNSPKWKRIKRKCKICGNQFWVKQSELKKGIGRGCFCSRKCFYRFKSIDPKTKEQLREIRKNIKTPTKPERIFQKICERKNLPFRYVGNGQLWVGKKKGTQLNPDFIEANGKKICVEVMGDYWHSPLLNWELKEYTTLKYRRDFYKRYKWQPFFIWESDLKRKDAEQFILSVLKEVMD